MIKTLIAFAFSLSLASSASATTVIACTSDPAVDTPAVNAAVAIAGAQVTLDGSTHLCHFNAPINFTKSSVILHFDQAILSSGNPVFSCTGGPQHIAIEGNSTQPFVWGMDSNGGAAALPGPVFVASGCLMPQVRWLEAYTEGWGIVLADGAGGYFDHLHFNGVPGKGTGAMNIQKWDTTTITNDLFEQFDHGFRIGSGAGGVWTTQISNVYLDRLNPTYGTAVWLEPGAGQKISQMQISNLWAGKMMHPLVINTSAVGSSVDSVQITNGIFDTPGIPKFEFYGGAPTAAVQSSNILFRN